MEEPLNWMGRALALPEELKAQRVVVLEAQRRKMGHEKAIKRWGIEEELKIKTEKVTVPDAKGETKIKAMFPSEAERKGELQQRKDANKKYQELKDTLWAQEKEVAMEIIDLEGLEDDFQAVRAVLGYRHHG